MASACVVGKYLYESKGIVCTVMKFSPTLPSDGETLYITDGLEYVQPLDGSSSFINNAGELLLAEQ